MKSNGRRFLTPMLLALGALFSSGAVLAEAPQPVPEVEAAEAGQTPVPMLWKVSSGETAIYLLGSFHLLRPDDYPLSPDVYAALEAADRVFFEIAPEELQSPETGMKMGQAALRTDGTPLDSALPEDTAAALDAWLQENAAALQAMQMPPPVLQMFQPWFAGLMVTMVEMGKYGLDPALGLDAHFVARAAEAGKTTSGLESVDAQIGFFTGMSDEEQVQFLQAALENTGETGREEIARLHRIWREGDDQALWNDMALEMRSAYPAMYQRINVDRNDAWVPQLEALLDGSVSGDSLVVVGALHLVGEDGVVEKLAAKGYAVERVCTDCNAGE